MVAEAGWPRASVATSTAPTKHSIRSSWMSRSHWQLHKLRLSSIIVRTEARGVKMRYSLLFLLAIPVAANAADDNKPIPTLAGDLAIIHNEAMQIKPDDDVCAVKVGGKLVFIQRCEGEYDPTVISNTRRKSVNGDDRQVIVIQRNPAGNACNGGPIFVVEVSKKYDPIVSPPLDFCGGASPVIAQNAKGLFITFPGGPVNHGSGKVPMERWQYQDGAFLRVK